jgi:hypothetical protein
MNIIRINGGIPGLVQASFDGQYMTPNPGENVAAFEARAIAAAIAAGSSNVCFGGLPQSETSAPRLRDRDGSWDGIE